MFAVKITTGFEQNVRRVGKYETRMEAVAAARWMKSRAGQDGRYYVAVPYRAEVA
jgi:hypothetical protein